MRNFTFSTYTLLYLMLFSPFLSYITLGVMGLDSTTNYFMFYVIFYGIIFITFSKRKISIPQMVYWLIIYSLYGSIWAFFNGELEVRGLFQILIRKENLSVILIIIIIYNTRFSDKFISTSLNIMKITTIIAAIVTIIQIFNFNFMNSMYAWNFFGLEGGSLYTNRRTSIFGFINLNELGLSFLPLLGVLIGYLLYKNDKNVGIFMFLAALICLLSNTRYVMLGFLVISTLIIIGKPFTISRALKTVLVLFILTVIFNQVFTAIGYNYSEWFQSRLFPEGSIEKSSRYGAWLNFLMFFPKYIYFGTGVHLTREIEAASRTIGSSQIHVGYLSHLLSFGIVGSIFLFGFWFAIIKKFYKTAQMTKYWGSFIGFMTFLFSQATLVYYEIFFYGIIFCFVFDKYINDQLVNNKLNEKI